MLFKLNDIRYIEMQNEKDNFLAKFELGKFNEWFVKYFKVVKKENDKEIRERARELVKQREMLLKGKYFDTESKRKRNVNIELEKELVDWIFSNLRCAFYDKALFYGKNETIKDLNKQIKDTDKVLLTLENCKHMDQKLKSDLQKELVNHQIMRKNRPKIQDMNYKPRRSSRPYFWQNKIAAYIIIEHLVENYDLSVLKAAQMLTGMAYQLDLINNNSTAKSYCGVLSLYKEAKKIYANITVLPEKLRSLEIFHEPPKFPNGLTFPFLIGRPKT